jgi:hypothetical protein
LSQPHLRLSECSRWPERQGCGQECLSQIEVLRKIAWCGRLSPSGMRARLARTAVSSSKASTGGRTAACIARP